MWRVSSQTRVPAVPCRLHTQPNRFLFVWTGLAVSQEGPRRGGVFGEEGCSRRSPGRDFPRGKWRDPCTGPPTLHVFFTKFSQDVRMPCGRGTRGQEGWRATPQPSQTMMRVLPPGWGAPTVSCALRPLDGFPAFLSSPSPSTEADRIWTVWVERPQKESGWGHQGQVGGSRGQAGRHQGPLSRAENWPVGARGTETGCLERPLEFPVL